MWGGRLLPRFGCLLSLGTPDLRRAGEWLIVRLRAPHRLELTLKPSKNDRYRVIIPRNTALAPFQSEYSCISASASTGSLAAAQWHPSHVERLQDHLDSTQSGGCSITVDQVHFSASSKGYNSRSSYVSEDIGRPSGGSWRCAVELLNSQKNIRKDFSNSTTRS